MQGKTLTSSRVNEFTSSPNSELRTPNPETQDYSALRLPKGLWALIFCLLSSVLLFGCSASEPPANPYSCPTSSGYTIPDYCKPGNDTLLNESVGQNWFKPYIYYFYSMNPTSAACDNPDEISGCSAPKTYFFKTPEKTFNDGDVTGIYVSLLSDLKTICSDTPDPDYTNLKNDLNAVCTNPPTNTLETICSPGVTQDLNTICSVDLTQELSLGYIDLLTSGLSTVCSGDFISDWNTVCSQSLPFELKRLCKSSSGSLAIKPAFDTLCGFVNKPPYPTGFDPSKPFSPDTGYVIASYDCTTANYATAAVGFVALDPEGTSGALDVGYSWFATDSENNPVGVFENFSQFVHPNTGAPLLLRNGAGTFKIWKAVDTVNQNTPILTYSCKYVDEFDCNNDGSVQDSNEKNVPMKVYDKEKDYKITVSGNDGVGSFSAQFTVKVRRLDAGTVTVPATTPAGTCPVLDQCFPSATECPTFQ